MSDYDLYHPLRGISSAPPLGAFARWSGLDFAPHPPPPPLPLSALLADPDAPPPTTLWFGGPAACDRTLAALAEQGRLDALVRLELRGAITADALRIAAALPRLEALIYPGPAAPSTALCFPRLAELSITGAAVAGLLDPRVTPALTRLSIRDAGDAPLTLPPVADRPLVALTLEAASIERRALRDLLDALRGVLERLTLRRLRVDGKRRRFATRWLDRDWPALVELALDGARLGARLPAAIERLTLTDVEPDERMPAPPPRLDALALTRCPPAVAAAFVDHAPRLRALEVTAGDLDADRLVAGALAPGSRLEALSLTGGFRLDGQRRVAIPPDPPPLRALSVDAAWTLGGAVEPLCAGALLPTVTHLRLQIGPSVWCTLDHLSPALEVLVIDAGPGFCLHGFTAAPPPPRLRTFAVSYVNVLGTRGELGPWLAQCQRLTTLELGFNGFDPDEVAHALRALAPRLESVVLTGWTGMDADDEDGVADVLTTGPWPRLVFLDISAFPFTPAASAWVAAATARMPRLEQLVWNPLDPDAAADALAADGAARLSDVQFTGDACAQAVARAVARLSRADARVANAAISVF